MLKVIESNPTDWEKAPEGNAIKIGDYFLQTKAQQKMCKYYDLPGVLPTVDQKHHTNVVKAVMQSTTQDPVKFLVDDSKREILTALDPRSTFVGDEEFTDMIKLFSEEGLDPKVVESRSGILSYSVMLPDSSDFLGDAIQKRVVVERMPQGGVFLSMGLMRLICTNGMITKEKETTSLFRNRVPNQDEVKYIIETTKNWNLEAYLKSKWFVDGRPLEASVGDYYGMRSCLLKATDEETAKCYFPTDVITEFYKEQSIDLSKINNKLRNRIPSGLSYYDCFNILTNGIKQVQEHSIEVDLEVAKWGFGHHVSQLAQTDIAVRGKPVFDPAELRRLKGDRVVA